jgi:hypothetical protein
LHIPKRVCTLALLLWCAGVCAGQTPHTAPKSKAADCATCHRSEAISQRATLMAHALELPGTNPILKAHPSLSFHRGDLTYTVTTQEGKSTYSVTDGAHTISLPIVWGFGAGAQTWLLFMDGRFYESTVSYFPEVNGLGITIGHESHTPKTLAEAIGRPLGPQDVEGCIGCHTTDAKMDDHLELSSFKSGVTCEHCHLGAAAHMSDALQNKYTSTPQSLGELSSEDISNFCGQCHRSWSTVVIQRSFGEDNVRFSPYRLALSRCFDGTDHRIGCLACHNPHVNLATSPAAYDAKCLACHALSSHTSSVPERPRSVAERPRPTPCPVAKSNCITCHMPKVKRADGHITFTDHFIRVVKPGEPYPD